MFNALTLLQGMREGRCFMKIFDSQDNYYVPAFFWIELNTAKELNEIFNTDLEHIFFHEYLHFLQDITTTYGYANSSHVLNLIKSFYHKIKNKEQLHEFDLNVPFDFSSDKYRDINTKLFSTYLQYYSNKEKEFDNFSINNIVPEIINIDGFKVQTFTIIFNNNKNIKLGAHSFFESISHILQKECYKKTDRKIYLPYDLPEKIAGCYSKIFSDKKYLIDLCEYSLMFFNPCEVFMNILEGLRSNSYTPKNTEDFYEYMKNQVSLSDCSVEDFFSRNKDELIGNINGVFTSELYDGFKKWLIGIVEKGYNLKLEKKLVFSKLLSYNPHNFLHNTIKEVGMPPTFNQDGKMFIRNNISDIDSWNFLARAITSVFETIITGKKECMLKEACLVSNEIREKQIEMNENCDNEPWKKITEEELCPYCAVWKTFGLSKMNIIC
jgi:hypothetical protein